MKQDVVSLAVVHRHGTRFPSQGYDGDLSYPGKSSKFWHTNRDALLPAGISQLQNLGRELRATYGDFLLEQPLQIFSTNTTRTVLSAVSCLESMLPEKEFCISDIYDNTPLDQDLINIRVCHGEDAEDLFPYFAVYDEMKMWQDYNFQNSPLMRKYSENKETELLLNKIYNLTEDMSFSKEKDNISRMRELPEILARYRISESSPVIPFYNTRKLYLNREEEKQIHKYSQIVCSQHFQPFNGLYRDEKGSLLTKRLLEEISEHLYKGEGTILYSAHDTTLLALSAALGWTIPCPHFSAYFIFEKTIHGTIRIYFNPDPSSYTIGELQTCKWHPRKYFSRYDHKRGETDLSIFKDSFCIKNKQKKL